MSVIHKCDGCEAEYRGGVRWLRVTIQPFYPQGGTYSPEIEGPSYHHEGLTSQGCSPRCVALILAREAAGLSFMLGELSEELGMFSIEDTADEAKSQG